MEVPVGEHLRLDIIMTPHWWIARGAGNCLDGSTARGAGNCLDGSTVGEHLRLDIIMTPHWWIARGAGNCLDGSSAVEMEGAVKCDACSGAVGCPRLLGREVLGQGCLRFLRLSLRLLNATAAAVFAAVVLLLVGARCLDIFRAEVL
ncbi:hypothetical protein E3N88_39991 [Mikania micrantha]|uniref:Uncharacterized protein n=1 Tax=Mikania micrantha TaxID=192012 RepID=A0A5N6LLH6_9ASTR|nr:hypothetical protein E3N88_39991 [Mikania micrantha]